jgi:Mg2+-importing ATPase
MNPTLWDLPPQELLAVMKSSSQGLPSKQARERLAVDGLNTLTPSTRGKGVKLLLSQFKSPLILLLIAAAALSIFLGSYSDAIIIFSIVLASGAIGFFQERGAITSLEKLMRLVAVEVDVWRDGKLGAVPLERIVAGDLVAGDVPPGDCYLLAANYLFVNEAVLTGESFPAEKTLEQETDKSILQRKNVLFAGSTIVSGHCKALVITTGRRTQFGQIAEQIRFRPPETAFESGVRRFGYFLVEVTMVLVFAIFVFNIFFQRPFLDSLLFSVALAVGLTPQLLPAIISVNLSHGARRMAERKVIVKRLASIENFGQMNVLCADKTGTITEGAPILVASIGPEGEECQKTVALAALNAHFQTGYKNPLDTAILNAAAAESGWKKIDERPYDFVRKRVAVLIERDFRRRVVLKGAVMSVLPICSTVEMPDGSIQPFEGKREALLGVYEKESLKGRRLIAVAYADKDNLDAEEKLTFAGFLSFSDPIKPGIKRIVANLKNSGVHLKIITGDNHLVAIEAARYIGLTRAHLVVGSELTYISDEALMHLVQKKNLFAEIEPNQKERIILALRKSGDVVGFLGDGINDVSALRSADIGIAVEGGADGAKEAADIVLLEKDLSVLQSGVEEGRRTFANTIKYVYMATSANFGNMFSMAGASLFLSFLPLLPIQVLLTNLLTDFPEMAIASDRVDPETIQRPLQWNLPLIRRFMVVFGLISSVFDYLTFGILIFGLNASVKAFRTGWLIESVVSAALIVLAVRTRRWSFLSRPGKWLIIAILFITGIVCLLPYTPLGQVFQLVPLPLIFYAAAAGVVLCYFVCVDGMKRIFFRGARFT